MEKFRTRRISGLYYSADSLSEKAGHKRLFGDRPGRGWVFYSYNEQAPGWAIHRRWDFKLFCFHHVGNGKATDPQGWHITWASFRRSRCCHRLTWVWADNFKTGPRS